MVNPQHVTSEAEKEIFCAVYSLEAGEPLFGSALHNDIWFLLEYEGPWSRKATTDNLLPEDVQAWLDRQVATVGRGRLQFIKQQRERADSVISFFVVDAREVEPRQYQFELADYSELLDIHVMALLQGEDDARRQDAPLYLVCTNGRRDRCCALFGLEVYYDLQQLAGDAVWQTTHVGGHRFAANVITFPDATYYGRVHTAEALEAFYRAHQQGEIALPYLRGRSCYEEWVQAADYFLRQETGNHGQFAFQLQEAQELGNGSYEATFVARGDGTRYGVQLDIVELDMIVYASCGKPGEGPCVGYELRAFEKLIPG